MLVCFFFFSSDGLYCYIYCLSNSLLYNTQQTDQVYLRAQGPNPQCMDYHDLCTKLYSPWDTYLRDKTTIIFENCHSQNPVNCPGRAKNHQRGMVWLPFQKIIAIMFSRRHGGIFVCHLSRDLKVPDSNLDKD